MDKSAHGAGVQDTVPFVSALLPFFAGTGEAYAQNEPGEHVRAAARIAAGVVSCAMESLPGSSSPYHFNVVVRLAFIWAGIHRN